MTIDKKTDLRVFKTKKAIRIAFVKLLTAKDIDKITIKDIADEAFINRKTFYNYYSGIYQLVDEIENEIVSSFEEYLKDMDFDNDIQHPYNLFHQLTAIIEQDMEFYTHLFRMDNHSNLLPKIEKLLKEKAKDFFQKNMKSDEYKLNLLTEYTISGIITTYKNWFNSERKVSLEQLAVDVSTITMACISSFMKE